MAISEEPRLSLQGLRILQFFAQNGTKEFSGAQLIESLKIASGTLYPILARFELASWLDSRWETANPSDIGRPRRRYYRITGLGVRKAATVHELVFSPAGA